MRKASGLWFLIIVAGLAMPPLSSARTGPEGRVRPICFGDVIDQYGGFNSFVVIRIDPAIEPTLVPSRPDYLGSYENAWRNMRIYMPRNYKRLTEDYDLIITSDADRMVFRTEWIDWLTRSVTDGGLSLEWLGSIASSNFQSWEGTTLAGIAPVDSDLELDISGPFRVKIRDWEEPLMKSLPWEETPPLNNLNTQIPKEGSRVWAVTDHPSGYPLMTYWKAGEGSVLCFASKFPNGVSSWARDWDFFPESMIYLVYRTVDRDLPMDPATFHHAISSFGEYAERSSTVYSIFAFVEKFGGRFNKLYRRVDEVADIKASADLAYLNGEYEECLALMARAKTQQKSIMQEAMEAKDRALFWVYVTEWCALTSTFLISGTIIWHLMVRRRLYREVGVSRMTYR